MGMEYAYPESRRCLGSCRPAQEPTILFSGQYDGGSDQGGYGATLPPYNALEAAGGIARKFWNKKVYSDPAMRQFTGWINGSGAARWINHRIYVMPM